MYLDGAASGLAITQIASGEVTVRQRDGEVILLPVRVVAVAGANFGGSWRAVNRHIVSHDPALRIIRIHRITGAILLRLDMHAGAMINVGDVAPECAAPDSAFNAKRAFGARRRPD